MRRKTKPPLIPRLAELRRRLLGWYRAERRTMPWRENPSPYRTVVSEFMLQQTQVATVIPYFERFVSVLPGFPQLALATEDQVLALWSGLGYYRRARFLREAAQAVVHRHAGQLPGDPEALRALPGFGEYTAAAVGSIALGLPMACVDGNVRRVVSRLMKLRDPDPSRLQELAAALLDPKSPGDWNQAMMELGAVVCTPRGPSCMLCPVRDHCAAFASGRPELFPAPKSGEAVRRVVEVAVAATRGGKVLILRRGLGGAFGGMWEFPRLDSREVSPAELSPSMVMRRLTGFAIRGAKEVGRSRSTFTTHRIDTTLHALELVRPPKIRLSARHTDFAWMELRQLSSLGASRAQKRLFELLVRCQRL